MVDDAAIAGEELHRAHHAIVFDRNGDDKAAIHVALVGRNRERLFHLQDEVWFAQFPAFMKLGRGREIGGVTFRRARVDPTRDVRELLW